MTQKYHNKPEVVDGVRFDSRKEARRYQDLRLLQRGAQIVDLELQPRFVLRVIGPEGEEVIIGSYYADFRYRDVEKQCVVVEDVKGVRTPVYRLKKKHVEAQYGITIQEI